MSNTSQQFLFHFFPFRFAVIMSSVRCIRIVFTFVQTSDVSKTKQMWLKEIFFFCFHSYCCCLYSLYSFIFVFHIVCYVLLTSFLFAFRVQQLLSLTKSLFIVVSCILFFKPSFVMFILLSLLLFLS